MNLDHRNALDRITSNTKTSHKVNAFLSASKSLRPAGQLPIGSKRTIHHKITEADGVLRRRLCVMRQIVAALNEIVANVFAAKHWTDCSVCVCVFACPKPIDSIRLTSPIELQILWRTSLSTPSPEPLLPFQRMNVIGIIRSDENKETSIDTHIHTARRVRAPILLFSFCSRVNLWLFTIAEAIYDGRTQQFSFHHIRDMPSRTETFAAEAIYYFDMIFLSSTPSPRR